jgi:hypothetical protein
MRTRVLIYTPTYDKSKGLQYRLAMLTKTLQENNYDVTLYKDEQESILRVLYTYTTNFFMQIRGTWTYLGNRIGNKVLKTKPYPDIVFLTTDVCSGAIKTIKSHGIKVVLLLEDLSVDWLNIHGFARKKILDNLASFASDADVIITPSESFSKRISEELGLNTVPVPPGLELQTTEDEAKTRIHVHRSNKPHILHARQLATRQEAELLTILARKLSDFTEIYALKAGKYQNKVEKRSNIIWYHYQSADDAIKYLKHCHMGLIVTPRNAPTFTSQWFYFSLLQPVIAITNNYIDDTLWISIEDFLDNPQRLQSEIADLMTTYEQNVKKLAEVIKSKYIRHKAHEFFVKILNEL